jgi:phospholipase C
VRRSRALPYELHVHARSAPKSQTLILEFHNTGAAGAVFHVYDKLHLDRIPRRYTVEAGKTLSDTWHLHSDRARYDLWVYGHNGFVREFRGASNAGEALPDVRLEYDVHNSVIRLIGNYRGRHEAPLSVQANAYRTDGPWPLRIAASRRATLEWSLIASHGWYDLTATRENFILRFAGRMENAAPTYSDPAV